MDLRPYQSDSIAAVYEHLRARDDNPTAPVPEVRPVAGSSGWDWLADAQRREDERLAQLRGDRTSAPVSFDPDRTNTAPIQLPR